MKPVINTLLVFMMLSLFPGCGTMKTLPASARTRAVGGSFDAVFDGILKYCSERGYPVKKSERTSGIIETDAKTNPFEHSRTRLAFTVQAVNSKTAEVTLLISIQNESSGGLWTQAAFSEEEARERYAMMFKEMEKYLVK